MCAEPAAATKLEDCHGRECLPRRRSQTSGSLSMVATIDSGCLSRSLSISRTIASGVFRRTAAPTGSVKRETIAGAAPESDVHADLIAFYQSDVLKPGDEPYASSRDRAFCGSFRSRGKSLASEATRAFLCFIQRLAVGLAQSLIFLLRFVQRTQLALPFRLQRVGDQTVGGVHVHVPALRQISFVTGAPQLVCSASMSTSSRRI